MEKIIKNGKFNPSLISDRASLLNRIADLETELANHRETAQELAASEERYALAVRGTHDGIFDWEIDSNSVTYSPRFKELLGFAESEISGGLCEFTSRLHPEDLNPTMEAIHAHLEKGIPYDVEYRLMHRNGEYLWFHARGEAVHNESGMPVRMAGAISDITEKKADELKLRLISNRLLLATRAGKIGVWDYDIVRNKLVWDDQMYRVYGVDPDEFSGAYEAWEEGLHPDDKDREVEKLQSAIRGETEFDTEFRVIWPSDGSVHYINANGIVLTNNDGEAVRMIGVNWDITESRQTHKELRLARVKAEAAAEAKSEFLANMSHEIRTPMNGIIGMAELLHGTDLNETQLEYVHLINQESDALLTIINEILDFSKIEAGKLSLEHHEFTLRDSIINTLQPLSVRATEKKIELAYRVDSDVPDALIGDFGRIRQILINLVGNAIKFTSEGEVVVVIKLASLEDDQVALQFLVKDTGIGIPLEKQKTIFDAFNQAENSTTRIFGGTGLGLSISQRLVEMMNGQILLDSEPGKGSCFRFTVELKVNPNPPDDIEGNARPATPESGRARPMKLLLVEDGEINRLVAGRLLEGRGHIVAIARDGVEAVEQFYAESFDAILMDVQMPRLDGYSATAAIRKAESKNDGSHTPIIAMTAHAMRGDRRKCLDAGMDNYIAKPIKAAELFSIIESYSPDGPPIAPPPQVDTDRAKKTDRSVEIFDSETFTSTFSSVDLIKQLIELFPRETGDYLDKAKQAIASGDADGLHYAAHSLKGTLGNYSAKRAWIAAKDLTNLSRSGNLDAAPLALVKCREEVESLGEALRKFGETLAN